MFSCFRRTLPPMPSSIDRLLSLWLQGARINRWTAIVFGMPRPTPASVANYSPAELAARFASVSENVFRDPREAIARAMDESSTLKSATGCEVVPTWARIDGELQPMLGPPLASYPALLGVIEAKLVSLGATERDPKPKRFIEYEPTDDGTARWVAEVECWFDGDNTVRLEILSHRREPMSVRASSGVT